MPEDHTLVIEAGRTERHYWMDLTHPIAGSPSKSIKWKHRQSSVEDSTMPETIVVELHLPADVAAALRARAPIHLTEEERLKTPLAIGLFVERIVSLAKAASLAGMTRYEFALLLKRLGLPAYEYTQTDYQEDLSFVSSTREI
jgi:predicted HTH domain antitoxin